MAGEKKLPKENLLEVENLTVSFSTSRGKIKAADGVSFYLHKGKVLVAGEVPHVSAGLTLSETFLAMTRPEAA